MFYKNLFMHYSFICKKFISLLISKFKFIKFANLKIIIKDKIIIIKDFFKLKLSSK